MVASFFAATSAPADPRRPFSARASKQSSVWEEEDGTSTAAVRPRVASDVAVVAARPSPGGGEDAQLGFGSASRASRDVHGAGSPALGPLRDPLAAGGRARAPRARSPASARRARASSPAVAARRRAPPRATANPIFAGSRFAALRFSFAPSLRPRRARPDPDHPSMCLSVPHPSSILSRVHSLSRSTRSRISS